MPSDTFLRLPGEKQKRVFEAAVDEFAAYRFREASINRVIKAAGIPRGSFYQYFKDKEDLYTHVLQEISKEKINIISAGQLRNMSFYELIRAALPPIFAWVEQNPRYSRIGLLMIESDTALLRRVMLNMTDSMIFLRELFEDEQRRGLIRAGVRVETVIQLLLGSAAAMIHSYYEAGDAGEALKSLLDIIDIICYGINAPGVGR
jgi:AcrR family transcriptional regulator